MFIIGQLDVLNNMYKHTENYVESNVYIWIRKKKKQNLTLAIADKKVEKSKPFQLCW